MKEKECFKHAMANLTVISIVFLSVFFCGAAFISNQAMGRTLFVGGTGLGNHTTIQSAVNYADDGDTVLVLSGTYEESVTVTKRITLKGEDRNTTIIDTKLYGHSVYVTSDWVNISRLTITGSKRAPQGGGVVLQDSNHCHISDIIVTNRIAGIILHNAHHNILEHNNITDNLRNLHLRDSKNNMVSNSEFSYGMDNIGLIGSNENTIENNTIFGNGEGIALLFSDRNAILGNEVIGNHGNGITLTVSENNTVTDNTISHNSNGIVLSGPGNNTITRNRLTANSKGIYLEISSFDTLSHNTLVKNGFLFYGDLSHWITHQIDTTNTADGKPVYYWKNVNGGTIPQGAGQVILANCVGVTVKNQTLINVTAGIQLAFSSRNILAENRILSNKERGIYLYRSDNNEIINNVLSDSRRGVHLSYSNDNTIAGNNVSGNREGISLRYSDDNLVVYNDIHENRDGIDLHSSAGNSVYRNNLVNNTYSALDGDSNFWDAGYPWGGNYWSDFTGLDVKSGSDQSLPGSDGIGDTSVPILGRYSLLPGASSDRYPLTNSNGPPPWHPLSPRQLKSETGDKRVILTWEPPAYDGSTPTLGYRVYRADSSGSLFLLAEVEGIQAYAHEGLENGEEYHYAVTAVNVVGESPFSNRISVVPMNRPPVCTISYPRQSTMISKTVRISGTSFDPDGMVQKVMIWFDDGPLVEVENSPAWDHEWDTTRVSNGDHTIHVIAYDGTDYSNITSISVEVYNQPSQDVGWIWFVIAVAALLTVIPLTLRLVMALTRRKQ